MVRLTQRVRRASFGIAIVAIGLGGAVLIPDAHAASYPSTSEAILLLDGTQTAPADGFNMQVDSNGFSTAGGALSTTHMYCVQSAVPFRCGIGDNDLIRVQGSAATAGLNATQSNQLAWLLTHRSGYDNQEVQSAIWCITNPGEKPPFNQSAQLCADSMANAAPANAMLALTNLGAATANEGSAIHFSLHTNTPIVDLSISDGGAMATLCGTAADNASASIVGSQLRQTAPATDRTFELCLTRSNILRGSVSASLTATLPATATNIQTWVHPIAPTKCQGLVDADVTSARQNATATGSWRNTDGWITVNKTTFGDYATGTTFTVELRKGTELVGTHNFPDTDASPWSHTFADLAPGSYTVVETDTGKATHVVATPNGPITIDRADGTTVAIVNQFVGQLQLTKHTDIPVDRSFPFNVDCTYQGAVVGTWTNPIKLAANQSFTTPELPAGTTCVIKEVDTGSAISTVIHRDDLGVQSESVGTQSSGVVIRNGQTTDVVFTNIFTQGSTVPSTIGGTSTSLATTSTRPGTVSSEGSTTPITSPSSQPSTGDLAQTGSDSDRIALFAVFALVAGAVLMLVTYRARRLRALR